MAPTKKQTEVLEALRFLIQKKGEMPTVREVGALIGLSSSATVKKHLDALKREGLISTTGKSRGIRLRDEDAPELPGEERGIQVMGRIAAGHPIEAVAEEVSEAETDAEAEAETEAEAEAEAEAKSEAKAKSDAKAERSRFPALAIDPHLFAGSGKLMALRVSGDSMIEAGILDGDYVIIRRQPQVEEGEIAAVDVDGEVTLKRWQMSVGTAAGAPSVRLVPANARFEPIEITAEDHKEVRVLGKYVGLVRGEIQL
jgi:repressor LexA